MDVIQQKAKKLGQTLKETGEKSERRNLRLGKLEESIKMMEDEAKLYEQESKKFLFFITKETGLFLSFFLMIIGSILILLSFI